MLKFFRKIRQRLLSENRFSKYLLYAIGEIALVVIGILIALQVNVRQETKKDQKAEAEYLKGILNDLDRDIYELQRLMDEDSSTIVAYTTILKAFNDDELKKNPKLIWAIGKANLYYAFDGNNSVFEDMKSSGKISLIGQNSLRFSILKYYRNSSKLSKSQNDFIGEKIAKLMDEAFTTNVDLNSLTERFIFDGKDSAEVDPLDMSFFDKDLESAEVQHFANRISLMKVLLKMNFNGSKDLVFGAQSLKNNIISYLNSRGVEVLNRLSPKLVKAIKNSNITLLAKEIDTETLDHCFDMGEESGNYLVHCITYKSLASLKFFVEKGSGLEVVCEHKTPLMYAIKYGELEMVKYLIEQGANVKANNHGKTPLYYARTYKHPEIEEYLIKQGAD